ncbi:peptidase inhibitor family I36 protein [Streptomyces sp. NBC_01285]|uniref:peptidase inhibitor family I36 protein n=1 Tax=Streptomyces sp. NBC_01285 TaxID=2903813 RepID=UPI002254DBFD|nr:peptidase inhibitor family I36 protein [Streptomyces sp. NBC_01285]MCX4773753.1 peptidase inhibitor family I36 protein [Streptomyces sp. NBC_01285]
MRLTRVLPLIPATVAAVFLGPVAPAQAATADCPSGYLCLWDQTHYNGNMSKFKDANASWSGYNINNRDSSWYNHGTSGLNACIWQGYYYTGSVKIVASGTSSPQDAAHAHQGSSNNWGC